MILGLRLRAVSLFILARLRLRVHELLHHQVYVDDGAEVQRPVEEAVAHELGHERPQQGEGEALRQHLPQVVPQVVPHLARQRPRESGR